MGTTSEKLQYLATTKTLLKNKINITGANITNDTFRQYPTKLQNALLNCWNNEGEPIFTNWGTKVNGEGTNVKLDGTINARMKITPKGNTSQIGTPTPSSPIPVNVVSGDNEIVVCGKNLLDLSLFNNTEYYSITDNNVISLKNDNRGWAALPYIILEAGTYTVVTNNTIKRVQVGNIDTIQAIATATSGNYLQFTLTATTKIGFKLFGLSGDTYPITYTKPMLLKGAYSTYPTSYTPYTSQNFSISLGTIELNKIGDYQDYIYKTDKWYLHKEVGKSLFTGASGEAWNRELPGNNVVNHYIKINEAVNNQQSPILNNMALYNNTISGNDNNHKCYISGSNNLNFRADEIATTSDLRTLLGTTNMVVYYILKNETDTEITNTTLINQLENLKGAMSYEGQTNISSGFMIVGASALGELE